MYVVYDMVLAYEAAAVAGPKGRIVSGLETFQELRRSVSILVKSLDNLTKMPIRLAGTHSPGGSSPSKWGVVQNQHDNEQRSHG
jgi:hypothetical protein